MLLSRRGDLERLRRLLRAHPIVGILGPRQVGKTTLARDIVRHHAGGAAIFDLEDPADLARLTDPRLALEPLRGLVVIDEIQRRPDLFPVLRVLADRPRKPARFLVLGSASPELLRQSSESLAGRVAYHELGGFSLEDVGSARAERLWLRGGFPRSFLARTEREGDEWRRGFVRTFVERDLPQLGVTIPARTLERFWSMLAHYHGQVWNAAEFSRSFGVSDATVRRYLDLLAATFVVRILLPWSENLGKRQVRSPKVYLSDSGILHSLLGVRERRDLERHPKLGASWEGFALDAVARRLGVEGRECHFWATHAGAELDLLVVRGRRRWGFEFKRTSAPAVTRSMHVALQDLRLERLDVVHGGPHTFDMARGIRAVALSRLLDDIAPLR